jgi:hypothetical protein
LHEKDGSLHEKIGNLDLPGAYVSINAPLIAGWEYDYTSKAEYRV